MNFLQLKKNAKKDFSKYAHTRIKVAVLGDTPTQLLTTSLIGYGFEEGVSFEIYEAEYQQAVREIMNASSSLYSFDAAFIIIFFAAEELYKKFALTPLSKRPQFAQKQIELYETLVAAIEANTTSKVILFNFWQVPDNVFGNFGNKTQYSFTYQLRAINMGIMQMAANQKNLFVLDVDSLQNQQGYNARLNKAVYVNTGIVTNPDFLVPVAQNITRIILSVTGRFYKCLIVDMDNTLWGGVIGDDGIDNIQIGNLGIGKAYTDLQLWIKQLNQRGVIIAVCSKNEESTVKEVFEKHPDMQLRMDDIAFFAVNWDNKADNIRLIQAALNISFDSMVFIDDNPFERNLVRKELPEVCVPELPGDPAGYAGFLQELNLFETASFTIEDTVRNEQYKKEAERVKAKQIFTNEDEYLANLDMKAIVGRFNSFNIPRLAQLSQRSNQFNLRTVRYTEKDIEALATDSNYMVFDFSLKDKFGDNGLVSMVVLKKQENGFFIENWLMSCRVLKRSLENFVLNTLVEHAIKENVLLFTGEYLPTVKNAMVKDFYPSLGFIPAGNNLWQLNLNNFTPLKTFIKERA
ncbi:MAG TPA: HAD-IIIC family phosphatase [Chitinophagaceae bacterium]|nr:HAD-IIIC family phosphatase [Chitinophagaceae bacterium]